MLGYFQQHLDKKSDVWSEILRQVDVDANGKINYSEFITALIDYKQKINEKMLKEAFDFFDQDKNSYISSEELRNLLGDYMEKNNAEAWQQMISNADLNRDGKVDFEEFKNMISPR